MQKKLLALIFLICLVASPFLWVVPAVKATTTSQTITIDIGTGTIDHYYLNSPGYSNFLMTIDLTNATFGAGYGTIIQFVDVYDLYGFMMASDGNGGMGFSDSFNTGETIMSYYPGNYDNYTMFFYGSSYAQSGNDVGVEPVGNGFEMSNTTSCAGITDNNPITQFIFNPTNVYNPSHGTVKITIDYYFPPATPTPTASPTPAPTATLTQNHTVPYTAITGEFADDEWIVNVGSDYEVVITNRMTVSSGDHYLGVDAEDFDGYGIWAIDFQNGTYLDQIQDTHNQYDNLDSNGTIALIVQGSTITFVTAFGSEQGTIDGGYPVMIRALNNDGDFNGGELDITVTAYPPSPSPTPDSGSPAHHGGNGGDTNPFVNPTQSPSGGSPSLPKIADFKLSSMEILGIVVFASVASVASLMYLSSRKSRKH